MNQILYQHGKKTANVAFLDDHLNLCKALNSEDVNKWEATMQEKYDLFMTNNMWELTNLLNNHKSVRYK